MKNDIQITLFFFLCFFQIYLISAQTERVKFVEIKKNRIEEIQSEKKQSIASEIETKKANIIEPKNDEILNSTSLIKKSYKGFAASVMQKRLDTSNLNRQEISILQQEKIALDNDTQGLQNYDDNNPIFLDLQVVATKETVQEDLITPMEVPSQQLQKLDKVPEDNSSSTIKIDPKEQVSISPSKRKYLESRVLELESEIKLDTNSAVELLAKKNELDEIKKLLVQ